MYEQDAPIFFTVMLRIPSEGGGGGGGRRRRKELILVKVTTVWHEVELVEVEQKVSFFLSAVTYCR